jgi:protein TonB
MRWVSFLILSMALHAAGLAFPLSFGAPSKNEFMRVTILPMEQESLGGAASKEQASPKRATAAESHPKAPPSAEKRNKSRPSSSPEPQVTAVTEVEKASDSSVAVVSASVTRSDNDAGPTSGFASQIVHGAGNGPAATGTADNGTGAYGAGSGSGSGNGDGSASSGDGIALSQARYRDTPRPEYPESARREGREGRVLLRVLVDDQGRSKKVEINNSSGSAALDRAAAEAIRRWRFHPARHGDAPTESWVNIPVEFRLKDQK